MRSCLLLYLLFSAHFCPSMAFEATTDQDSVVRKQTVPDNRPTQDPFRLKISRLQVALNDVKKIEYIFILFLGALGVVSNLLILVVTAHYKSIGIPDVYIVTLAICDTFIGVFGAWNALCDNIHSLSERFYWFSVKTIYLTQAVDVAASITASLILMALSIDRCLALKFPMKYSEVWSVRKAKVLAVITCLISIVVSLNIPLRLKICTECESTKNWLPPMFTDLGNNKSFTKVSRYSEFLLRFAIPIAFMTVTNTWTISIIRKSDQFRRRINKDARHTVKTPKCLTLTVGIVIIFFITQLPLAVFQLDAIVFYNDHRFTVGFECFVILSHAWTKVNSIINIFVYLLLNEKFRRTLFAILKIRKRKSKETSTMATISSHVENEDRNDNETDF
ncbi:hypothetical protein CAPTEDRAFT_204481 [Capitella teleta]|uniref:G-protein coupled receptors family 1 profile domain-containing protein n=1 Tax=Capitella teleta TaxID=283909 RepID=R7TCW8_CAPTE|nr:hypothetical protein CAPTEDRAFT_204481 [Capitella teleta]|eukprot:ELT91579.1 hypothetical protein CAPTEDRAFT_204481 [Capitella teleta]